MSLATGIASTSRNAVPSAAPTRWCQFPSTRSTRCCSRRKGALTTTARLSLPKLPVLDIFFKRRESSSALPNLGLEASAELLDVLAESSSIGSGGSSGGSGSKSAAAAAGRQRVSELVDTLLEAGEGAPFNEAYLGGGPWVVVYTRGPLLWKAATSPGRLVNPDNEFSQDFDPAARTVVNRGELLGAALYVTAEGTYAPLPAPGSSSSGSNSGSSGKSGGSKSGSSKISSSSSSSSSGGGTSTPRVAATGAAPATTPVLIRAAIERGTLHLAGGKAAVPLPIRGAGDVSIAWLDPRVRVFRQPSSGSVTVQVRRAALRPLLGLDG